MIRLESVSFSYNGKPTLSNLSLDIKTGEFVGVIGPNGAGKSTLLRLMSKLLKPGSGRIWIGGKPLDQISIQALAREMAVLPAETFLAYDFTVEEVVRMGRAPHLGFFAEGSAGDDAIVDDALGAVDLSHLRRRNIHSLSSGERQRVFLAQALAQEPKIFLLDEPTVHLDVQHQLQTFRILREWNRKRGMTIVVISHDLNTAGQFCSRLILLNCGTVIVDGTPKEVLTEDHIRRVYEINAKVMAHPKTGSPAILFE